MTICIAEEYFFELRIKRKPIKNAYIKLLPNKVIEVSAPARMPNEFIEELIRQKTKWILNSSGKIESSIKEEEIKLMPISQGQIDEMKYKAEDMVFDSLERMYPLVKELEINYPEIRVRYMTSRWGSCIINKSKIWINVYLVNLPEGCMDYVVLHELLHFVNCKHDKGFYQLMARFMPNWKDYDDILNKVRLPPKRAAERASYI